MSASFPKLELAASRHFVRWLDDQRLSLAFTTYQAGKLFLIGRTPENKLSFFERTFDRCMGLGAKDNTLWMSAAIATWRFENALPSGTEHHGYDAVFVPQLGYTTGDLDIHDVAIDDGTVPVFVNTLFSCLARPSNTHSFKTLWTPPFISRLAAEDRCHLNGLALVDDRPRFVTSTSRSDVADGWRDHRHEGGVVIDIRTNEIITDGLSMPHSPRWHQDRLWLLESGTGYLGFVGDNGEFERVCLCPGYARGMSIVADFAVVGVSNPRHDATFGDLALAKNLSDRNTQPRCGLLVIDLRSGTIEHWLRIRGVVQELYDVASLPGIRRPMALGFKTDEIRRTITYEV